MKKKKIRYLLHWCMNNEGHRNKGPHSYYVKLGHIAFRQRLAIKFRSRNAVVKACPICKTKKDVAVSRIVTKEAS